MPKGKSNKSLKWTATLHPRGLGGKFTTKAKTEPTAGDKLKKKVSAKLLKAALADKGLSAKLTKKVNTPDLSKLGLKELKGLAADRKIPKPKNAHTKAAWIAALTEHAKGKGKPEPAVPVTKVPKSKPAKVTSTPATPKHTAESLGKMKLAELKKLASEVGAKSPEKYSNRKQAWMDSILAHTGSTPKAAVKEAKPQGIQHTKGNKVTHQELIAVGAQYSKKYLKPSVSKALVDKLEKDMNAAQVEMKEVSLGKREGDSRKAQDKYLKAIHTYLNTKEKLGKTDEQMFEQLRKDLVTKSRITEEQAKEWASGVNISHKISGQEWEEVKDNLAYAHRLSNGKVNKYIEEVVLDDDRAYYMRSKRLLNVGDYSYGQEGRSRIDAGAVVHEAFHGLEYENPHLQTAAKDFRAGRTKGASLKVSSVGEKYLPDKFVSNYVGRVYGDLQQQHNSFNGTEVLSVGAEHFTSAKAMKKLYEADREHFNFMIGIFTHEN